MGKKYAARETDFVAHGGSPCSELGHSQTKVFVEGELLATVETPCKHASGKVATGAKKVLCLNKRVARNESEVSCGGKILTHAERVFIGGPEE